MLRRFPQYFKRFILMSAAVTVLIFALRLWGSSFDAIMHDPFQLLLPVALSAIAIFGCHGVVRNKMRTDIFRIARILEEDCDPARFVQEAQPLIPAMHNVQGNMEVWFLTYYALGLVEAGRVKEAADLVEELRNATMQLKPGIERAQYLMHLEPAARAVFGDSVALAIMDEAIRLIESDPRIPSDSLPAYMKWERDSLTALRDGNIPLLEQQLLSSRNNEKCSWFLRVRCASSLADIYRAQQDEQREREELAFVLEHGEKLSQGISAQARLAELNA